VVTGHAGDENAAKLTRAQKEQLKEALGGPPSQSGIKAGFRDVPALRDVVKILFDVEYQSDSTYQLLLKFCGMSFKLPDPFDKRRDEAAITARMAQIRQEVVNDRQSPLRHLDDACESARSARDVTIQLHLITNDHPFASQDASFCRGDRCGVL